MLRKGEAIRFECAVGNDLYSSVNVFCACGSRPKRLHTCQIKD